MKRHLRIAGATLLSGSLLAIGAAAAQTPPQGSPDAGAHALVRNGGLDQGPRGPMGWEGGPSGPPPGPAGGPDHGPGGFEDGLFMPPPFLMGLHLTQEQQDKVFSILYAAAPKLREQGKTLRAAREALMKAGTAENFDETAVQRQADAAAKAQSELTLLRVRSSHQIYEVLTPEQRMQLEKHRNQHGPHGTGEPPPV